MNDRLKLFLFAVILIIILFIFPSLLDLIQSPAANFAVRTLLVLIAIYLIILIMKYIKKDK